jgi:hypothetical protein
MITTNVTMGKNFYVWTDNPEGPWSEPIFLDWPGNGRPSKTPANFDWLSMVCCSRAPFFRVLFI